VIEVIRVAVEVWDGATRSRVVTQAESVREAASTAAALYPNADVRVKFPIDAEAFFVEDSAAQADIVSFERPEERAA
jgi:hypothetical protein